MRGTDVLATMRSLEVLGLSSGKRNLEHDVAAIAKSKLARLKRLELRGR